jgi:carboxylesterase
MLIQYLEGAEPLYIKGSNTGCLLLHGAGGGTAWDLKEFAYEMNKKTGFTVWLPSLTGFGTRPEDLFEVNFSDWMNDARNGLLKLREDCDNLYILGHSMGGLLTLLLASENHNINAIVTWAAPFKINSRLLTILPLITKIPILKRLVPERVPTLASDQLIEQGWVGYDWIPSSIGFVVIEGLKALKESLHNVTCPAFIIQGTRDESVSKDSAQKIYDSIQSGIKDIWLIRNATHPLMNEEQYKEDLFIRTITFFEKALALK